MEAARLPRPDELAKRIHNTIVAPEATLDNVRRFCEESKRYRFGAVVVQGCWTSAAKGFLAGSGVGLSVGVGFPMGGVTTEAKVAEIAQTARLGAEMFEYMPNMGYLKSGIEEEFRTDVEAAVKAAEGRPVRVSTPPSLDTTDLKLPFCTSW